MQARVSVRARICCVQLRESMTGPETKIFYTLQYRKHLDYNWFISKLINTTIRIHKFFCYDIPCAIRISNDYYHQRRQHSTNASQLTIDRWHFLLSKSRSTKISTSSKSVNYQIIFINSYHDEKLYYKRIGVNACEYIGNDCHYAKDQMRCNYGRIAVEK